MLRPLMAIVRKEHYITFNGSEFVTEPSMANTERIVSLHYVPLFPCYERPISLDKKSISALNISLIS
jgi:hypothetical protein